MAASDGPGARTQIDYEVVTGPEGLNSLETDWDDLFARAEQPLVCQSFAWLQARWETLARPHGQHFFCLVVRHEGRAILIWPMFVQTRWGLWRDAFPAGAGGTEYGSILVDRAFRRPDILAAAWRRVRRDCPAHLIRLRRVRTDSDLHGLATSERLPVTSVNAAPYTSFDDHLSWDDYLASRRGSLKRELSRQQRRLEAQGTVTFEILPDEEYQAGLDWLLHHKGEQMRARGYAPVASASDEYRSLWARAGRDSRLAGRVVIFALKVDGAIVAAELDCIDGTRVESFIGAYDPTWSKFGPGALLNAFCLRWAFERRLDYDFRIGTEGYKYTWSNRNCDAMNYEVVNRPWGWAFIGLRTGVERISGWRRTSRETSEIKN